MHFAYGETRFVIVTNRYAFKVARIRPFRLSIRIFTHFFCKKKVSPELLTYDNKMARRCVRSLMPGIVANRAEYRIFKKHKESGDTEDVFVPTLFSFFWLVNIQLAGRPATQKDVERHVLYRRLRDNPLFDLGYLHQYCVIKGKPLLLDYGQEHLEPFLAQQA